MKVRIFGAGSIGNHLANGCRNRGWDVEMTDVDEAALQRTKDDIYPARYGQWDEGIRLTPASKLSNRQALDVVIIGTPPGSHFEIALKAMKKNAPRVLLIEKPLCPPDLKNAEKLLKKAKEAGTILLVGYNHVLTKNTVKAKEFISAGVLGAPQAIHVQWLEHWGGIFGAHPWLAGPWDSYLGFSERGGGSCGEHSHAINIWQHMASLLGAGRISAVQAMMDMVDDGQCKYDRTAMLQVQTDKGLAGTIIQDVVTEPSVKSLRIQGASGFMSWHANYAKGQDALIVGKNKEPEQLMTFAKTRPDDFAGEIEEVGRIVETGSSDGSPIAIERGLDTMMVIAAAYRSHAKKRAVEIHYEDGYSLKAIRAK